MIVVLIISVFFNILLSVAVAYFLMERRKEKTGGKSGADKVTEYTYMHRNAILSMPKDEVAYYEFNLTEDECEYMLDEGGAYNSVGEVGAWDDVAKYFIARRVHPEDKQKVMNFIMRDHLLDIFGKGNTDVSLEYRGIDRDMEERWMRVVINMIACPDQCVKAYIQFSHIEDEKAQELQMRQDIEELKIQLENSRIKVMINQMRPHFLYNALSSIRVVINQNPEYASELIYDFATYLRANVKALSGDEPITFAEELGIIKAYLNIEKMRFGEKLKVEYDISVDDFTIIPLSIQPVVENAVRHGIYQRGKRGGTVRISSSETENSYIIRVEDDGVGFDKEEVLVSRKDSVGLRSLIFRLQSLLKATVTVDTTIDVGTVVVVEIPKEASLRAGELTEI